MAADSGLGVSVVVPLLNEAATVDELVARIVATLEAGHHRFELILVDDGSSDGTGERLREHEAEDGRLRVFQFSRNFGQAAALACGIFEARGDVVVTLDGDLQNPPEEIPRLLDALEKGADVASARRRQRYEGFGRWLGSRAIHRLARTLTGVALDDIGGQFKAYRRVVVEAVRSNWAPGKPVFPLALWLGFPVAEVTVEHGPRRSGESRYTLRSLLRINVDLITAFSTLPLAAIGIAGALCFAAGVAGLALCLWLQPAGWLPGAASLTGIAVGALLLAAGVLGQYLGRVYRNVAGDSPGWVVRRGPSRGASPQEGGP
jgi:undecaprenyl-phosphate 4-deoxy-4-formamido-L-arabinose transferase